MSQIKQSEILALIRKGDKAGFKTLYLFYYKSLCLQAFLILKDQDEAEDVVQEVFTSLWSSGKLQTVETSLSAYLSTTIRFACFDFLKKKERYEKNMNDYPAFIEQAEIEDPLETRETAEKLNLALLELPEQCRIIFDMVCINKRKYQDVADTLGISINTVKTQMKRAFSKLRMNLNNIRK